MEKNTSTLALVFMIPLLTSCLTIDVGTLPYVEYTEQVNSDSLDLSLNEGEVKVKQCVTVLDSAKLMSDLLTKMQTKIGNKKGLSNFSMYGEGLCSIIQGAPK